MARIDERRKLLEAKLQEMAEDGVKKCDSKATLSYDSPDEENKSNIPETTVQEEQPFPQEDSHIRETVKEHAPESNLKTSSLSLDDYRMRYFQSIRIREKTAFTMNVETLQILRNVLQDLGERVSMASYIDNILREHLKAHKELLNNATSKQRRKTTINI